MKSTSAAQVSIHALSPADCADADAASNFVRRSASVCAKATSGAAATESRAQTHPDAPQDLLIINVSRLSFCSDSRTQTPARERLKTVTRTRGNNARATRHGRRYARRRARPEERRARLFGRFSREESRVSALSALHGRRQQCRARKSVGQNCRA